MEGKTTKAAPAKKESLATTTAQQVSNLIQKVTALEKKITTMESA